MVRVSPTMASSDDSTTAASRARTLLLPLALGSVLDWRDDPRVGVVRARPRHFVGTGAVMPAFSHAAV